MILEKDFYRNALDGWQWLGYDLRTMLHEYVREESESRWVICKMPHSGLANGWGKDNAAEGIGCLDEYFDEWMGQPESKNHACELEWPRLWENATAMLKDCKNLQKVLDAAERCKYIRKTQTKHLAKELQAWWDK